MTIRVLNKSYPRRIVEGIITQHMRLIEQDRELYTNAIRLVCNAFDIAESYTSRIITDSTLEIATSSISSVTEINIAPISQIESVSYIDPKGNRATLDADKYNLVASGCFSRIEFFDIPRCTDEYRIEKFFIKCMAGYGDSFNPFNNISECAQIPMPGSIVAAVQLIAGTLSMVEGDIVIGRLVSDIPMSAKSLLNPYRILPYASK